MVINWFLKRGVLFTTTAITFLCVLASAIVTTVIMLITGNTSWEIAVPIAVFIPLVLAPTFVYKLCQLNSLLEKAKDKLQILARQDVLVKIFNRRYFMELAVNEIERSRRYGYPVSLLLLDVDNFKQINDKKGHLIGDELLKFIGAKAKSIIRSSDIIARFGGDEFVFLLPSADIPRACSTARRIQSSLRRLKLSPGNEEIHFSVSIGVFSTTEVSGYPGGLNLNILLNRVDKALYKAKENGRDRIEVFKEDDQ